MATAELVPYSPELQDEFDRLTERRELLFSQRAGLQIYQHWFRTSNTVRMTLIEEGFDAREFPIPSDQVLEAQDHPEAYAARAGKFRKITRPYEGSYG